jgi:hypothetical protein
MEKINSILLRPINKFEEIMIAMQSPVLRPYIEPIYNEIAEKGYYTRSVTLKVDEE